MKEEESQKELARLHTYCVTAHNAHPKSKSLSRYFLKEILNRRKPNVSTYVREKK